MTSELAVDPGPCEVERVMEALVYEHLIDLIDFDRMHQLEEILYCQLGRLRENGQLGDSLDESALLDCASAIVERAWHKVITDPRRFVDFRGEWHPDDDCDLCKALSATESTKPGVGA